MASDSFAVDPRTAFVIHRAETQKYAVVFPALRQGESPVIPEGLDEIRMSYTRQTALDAKRHRNLLVESGWAVLPVLFYPDGLVIHREIPSAVQIDPGIPPKLRLGMFRTGYGRFCM
ncbi:hypothetical protein ES703_104803 [subsurface metagenome]